MSEMNSIEQTKTHKSSWLDARNGRTDAVTPFPLTCVYKSPSKTHQLMCHSAQVYYK